MLGTSGGESYNLSMDSSSPGTSGKPDPFNRDLIEKEIAHLKKSRSVRYAQEQRRGYSRLVALALVLGALWMFGMDPFLFAYNRGDAIHTYLYLHNYGDDRKAAALAQSGYFDGDEVQKLDNRAGSFQDYFVGTQAADKKADALIRYMQGVRDLHAGHYAALTPLNKIRFVLFMETHLNPPVRWDFLNPSIDIK